MAVSLHGPVAASAAAAPAMNRVMTRNARLAGSTAREKTMGRPPISEAAMSSAERVRRHRMTAAEWRAQRCAEYREQREWEEQRRRDSVIEEFKGNMQTMADAISEYRRALGQIADGIEWMQQGAPFVTMGPGPYWKPKPASGDPNEPSPDHDVSRINSQ
jgi:hypothetical protein